MTARLYYDDPYLSTFDAIVTDVRQIDGRWQLALDRSAFYPTSGGQLHDAGLLRQDDGGTSVQVVDVLAEGDVVWHVVDLPLAVGARVAGDVDARRRADHREQHSGQHVLSASCASVAHAETRSVHLGAGLCTLDVDGILSPGQLEAIEDAANRVVRENRAVHVRYVDGAEAATLPLRRPTSRTGTVRLVEIDGHDLSACGGTHVTATGEIGAIVVRAAERFKGGTRLTFVCGGRAVQSHRLLARTLDAAARPLSVGPLDVPAALVRLQDEARDLVRARDEALERLGHAQADVLSAAFVSCGDVHLLARALPDADATAIRRLAAALVDEPGRVVVLLGGPAPHALVVARSADVTAVDAGALARAIAVEGGGKAGGRPDFAQGGGIAAPVGAVVTVVRQAIEATPRRQ